MTMPNPTPADLVQTARIEAAKYRSGPWPSTGMLLDDLADTIAALQAERTCEGCNHQMGEGWCALWSPPLLEPVTCADILGCGRKMPREVPRVI